MSNVLALIPARVSSKGIPRKNFRSLCGVTPLRRAVDCARAVREIEQIVVSTDAAEMHPSATGVQRVTILYTGPPIHTDTCPMIDVVKDALARIPGPPDQIVLLIQPTQPLRQPKHLTQAIALLEDSGADSVVSVVELPRTHSPDMACAIDGSGRLWPWMTAVDDEQPWLRMPRRRQEAGRAYIRDGTCYCFRRSTVAQHGTIYGQDVCPLIIPPYETCPLDTPLDWLEAERRLRERAG